jgi:DNA modification methylase
MDKLTKTRGKFSKAGEPPRNKLPSSLQKFNDQEILSKEKWEYLLYTVFQQLFHFLTPNSPLIIFIGNMYRNIQPSISNSKKKIGQYLPLNSFLSSILLNIGYYWIKELIWMDPGKKLGVYGYPYVWIPSMMDQRILIFKKP